MAHPEIIKTLLLLALPASGKSELRRLMNTLTREECVRDFRMGHTVQLDDYPWVELFRAIDDAALKIGLPTIFFQGTDQPFKDQYD